MITLEGFITAFEITPASTDNRESLRDMTDGSSGITVLGDKGYVDEKLHEKMKENGICLMSLNRFNSKKD